MDRPSDRRLTPPTLYALLDREFSFALDAACDSTNQLAPHGVCRDRGQDGLTAAWGIYGGAVFCNPPYSAVSAWLWRGARASLAIPHPIVFLVHADTSTAWWREVVAGWAAEVRFITGRLRHLDADGNRLGADPWPSAVVVFRRGSSPPPTYSYLDRPAPRGCTIECEPQRNGRES